MVTPCIYNPFHVSLSGFFDDCVTAATMRDFQHITSNLLHVVMVTPAYLLSFTSFLRSTCLWNSLIWSPTLSWCVLVLLLPLEVNFAGRMSMVPTSSWDQLYYHPSRCIQCLQQLQRPPLSTRWRSSIFKILRHRLNIHTLYNRGVSHFIFVSFPSQHLTTPMSPLMFYYPF